MILPVLKYGDPVLRQKGRRIERVTAEIDRLIEDMFETMYAARGIGLAAQQIGHALQLTTLDVRGVPDRPSTMTWRGKEVVPDDFMPMVLINPVIQGQGSVIAGPEGCLSFPEIYTDILRPEFVRVTAWDRHGQPIEFEGGGLLARAIQHEYDHLQGILFIDRMTREVKDEFRPQLEQLQKETREAS